MQALETGGRFRTLRVSGLRRRGILLATMVLIPGALLMGASPAAARIRVVASTTDLGSIATAVGGDQVEVVAINRPNSDPHRVEVLPSYMVRVSRARIYLKVGMTLDQWADQIIDGSHNSELLIVDCSKGIEALEKPAGRVDASMGDVHPSGNPHYWLDPRNGETIARTVAEALGQVDPGNAGRYAAAAEDFARRCEETALRAAGAASELPVKEIVTYHQSWIYLATALGLTIVGTVEPVPGIPPTARHLADLVELIQQHRVPLLIAEPYFSNDAGEFLHRETGVVVAKISPSCEDVSAGSYLAHFDSVIEIIASLKPVTD